MRQEPTSTPQLTVEDIKVICKSLDQKFIEKGPSSINLRTPGIKKLLTQDPKIVIPVIGNHVSLILEVTQKIDELKPGKKRDDMMRLYPRPGKKRENLRHAWVSCVVRINREYDINPRRILYNFKDLSEWAVNYA